MAGEPSKGRQPEALRSLEAAAQAGSKKPEGQGLQATQKIAPVAASLDREQTTAANVLKAGADKNRKGMEKAAKDAPDR